MLNYPQATVACFDPTQGELPRRRLDGSRLRAFLGRLAEVGVPAVLIAASTGHGHLRTVEELRDFFVQAVEADLKQTAKMALLRPEDGEAENRQLLELLKQLSYDVVFFRPGTNLPADASEDQITQNLSPLVAAAAETGIVVGLYSIPDVSGLPLPPAAAARLVSGPGGQGIVAIKVTEANYQQSTLQFLQHPALRHLKIVQGWDPHLAQALSDGLRYSVDGRQRCGITSGPMSLAVFQYLHILQAAEGGDREEVEQSQRAVTALFASMQDDSKRFADLQRAKYIMGLGHPLLGEITSEQVQRVLTALQDLPRKADRQRLARSLDLMADGPFHDRLVELAA